MLQVVWLQKYQRGGLERHKFNFVGDIMLQHLWEKMRINYLASHTAMIHYSKKWIRQLLLLSVSQHKINKP